MYRRKLILASVLFPVLFAGCSEALLPEEPADGDFSGGVAGVVSKAVNTPDGAETTSLLLYFDHSSAERFAAETKALAEPVDGFVPTGLCELDSLFNDLGVISFRRVFPYVPSTEERTKEYGLDRWFEVTFRESVDLKQAASSLSAVAQVQKIQFNTVMQKAWDGKSTGYSKVRTASSSPVFNDPMLADQWHYINNADTGISLYAKEGADINVKDAWKLTAGDPRVIVAVVDEGVKYSHPDLAANMWINADEVKDDGADNDINADGSTGNGYVDDIYGYNFAERQAEITWDREKDSGHGTHVAGTVAAVNNNGVGVCGVAGGSGNGDGVRIMSCQIYSGKKGGTSSICAEAFKYAADNGAVILQCSFGYTGGMITSDNIYESAATIEAEALRYFVEKSNLPEVLEGGLAIFAAGNDSQPMCSYPGAYRECISVTAIGPDNLPAYYTNYGPGSNIAAPGGETSIGINNRSGVLSTIPNEIGSNEDYGYMEGTSMACPHVSGVAALGLSYALKSGVERPYTRDEFTDMLLTSVNDLEYSLNGTKEYARAPMQLSTYRGGKMGSGSIDAWRLMMQIEGTPCLVAEIGKESKVSLVPYFGGGAGNLTYTGLEIGSDAKEALGVEGEPEIRYGKLFIKCTKPGSAKITVKAIAGGDTVASGDVMGGTEVTRTVSILARGVQSGNGGWL